MYKTWKPSRTREGQRASVLRRERPEATVGFTEVGECAEGCEGCIGVPCVKMEGFAEAEGVSAKIQDTGG